MTYVFIRNDDVGVDSDPTIHHNNNCDYIPDSLKGIVKICIDNNIPITLGIIPDRLNEKTSLWIRNLMKKHSKIIEIAQHGYRHIDHGCKEFGSCRSYDKQYNDILNGMNTIKYFLGTTPKIFIPPHNRYNATTISVLKNIGFKILSAKYRRGFLRGGINLIGHLAKRDTILDIPVSYHERNRDMKEISISIDLASSYTKKVMKSEEVVLDEVMNYSKHCNIIGLMIHHWMFKKRDLKTLQNIILKLKKHYEFKKIGQLVI